MSQHMDSLKGSRAQLVTTWRASLTALECASLLLVQLSAATGQPVGVRLCLLQVKASFFQPDAQRGTPSMCGGPGESSTTWALDTSRKCCCCNKTSVRPTA